MSWIDIVIVALVGAAVYAEVKRGLLFAVADVVRIVAAVVLGIVVYSLVRGWTRDYVGSAIAFFVAAMLAVVLLDLLAKKMLVDAPATKNPLARAGAGAVGLGLGLAICIFVVPVLANLPGMGAAASRSALARPFLDAMPAISMASDQLGIDLPQAARRPARFSDEGSQAISGPAPGTLAPRVRFSRLDGATCIACRGQVRFLGYFRTQGASVSPKFQCENCGRLSDGCQTFEGFHAMYGACPVQVATDDQAELDCGVWPNDKPVLPLYPCPVCGLEGAW